jgi:hypothetical protein
VGLKQIGEFAAALNYLHSINNGILEYLESSHDVLTVPLFAFIRGLPSVVRLLSVAFAPTGGSVAGVPPSALEEAFSCRDVL